MNIKNIYSLFINEIYTCYTQNTYQIKKTKWHNVWNQRNLLNNTRKVHLTKIKI